MIRVMTNGKAAFQGGAGHPCQGDEEKNGVCRMKEQIVKVMAPGVQAVELTIQHVGQPGKRMPVIRIGGLECPDQVLKAQPFPDMNIFEQEDAVIKIDEFMILNGPEHHQNRSS